MFEKWSSEETQLHTSFLLSFSLTLINHFFYQHDSLCHCSSSSLGKTGSNKKYHMSNKYTRSAIISHGIFNLLSLSTFKGIFTGGNSIQKCIKWHSMSSIPIPSANNDWFISEHSNKATFSESFFKKQKRNMDSPDQIFLENQVFKSNSRLGGVWAWN